MALLLLACQAVGVNWNDCGVAVGWTVGIDGGEVGIFIGSGVIVAHFFPAMMLSVGQAVTVGVAIDAGVFVGVKVFIGVGVSRLTSGKGKLEVAGASSQVRSKTVSCVSSDACLPGVGVG